MLQFCPQCGEKRSSDGKYCPSCGALIGAPPKADKPLPLQDKQSINQNSGRTKATWKGFSWKNLDWKWVGVSAILLLFIGNIISEIFPPFGSIVAGFICGYIVAYGSPGETIYEAAVGIAIGLLLSFIALGWRGEELGTVLFVTALYAIPSIAGAVIGEKQQKKRMANKKH